MLPQSSFPWHTAVLSYQPDFIPTNRTKTNATYCPAISGCGVVKDVQTMELALQFAKSMMQKYCKVPFIIVNHLHRVKVDANRPLPQAAFGDTIAEDAWWAFHDFIHHAQVMILDTFGTVVNTLGHAGARGLLLDLHGYAGWTWNATGGGPYIHWGYRLSPTTLNECPLHSTRHGGSLHHISNLPGQSVECLVRGPNSIGSRVANLFTVDDETKCGAGLPSFEYPNPFVLKNDANHCQEPSCNYFSGGYSVKAHSRINGTDGIHFGTVQAELPRCIRLYEEVHEPFANVLATALCSFLRDVFPTSDDDDKSMLEMC
jgi:hypothetical protein